MFRASTHHLTIRQSVLALVAKGLTDNEIAGRLGVSRDVVIGHRHRAKVEPNMAQVSKNGREVRRRGFGAGRSAQARGAFAPNWRGGIGPKAPEPRQPTAKCKYIEGDPRSAGWSYCGKSVCWIESSYCRRHHDLCHMRPRPNIPRAASSMTSAL